MFTSCIYLSLGSNSGDRHAMIGKATSALADLYGRYNGNIRIAEPYTSMPEGFDSPNPFVNVGALVTIDKTHPWTDDELHLLLDSLRAIEGRLSNMPHRNADGSYRDREIDIDIIAVDDLAVDFPDLKIPHPSMDHRAFVLVPMTKLMPGWRHPLLGLTPAQMLENLKKNTDTLSK
ncbi:MAG: 2-amino-4-hydroxy-6-hydroxymethyldihydropteridine diphosphokinase [Muribaculaceae bacterium]|nr:2-amino-4-hydroxy-6-hydroxymethyldihydropteridine diphosphokinase [Muribaculaceae bacterium]